MITVRLTDRCRDTYPWMMFGYCVVRGIRQEGTEGALAARQRELAAYIRQNRDELSMRAKRISSFYRQQGEKSRSHIESLIAAIANGKEIKPVNVVVDAVMVAELRHALLLGVHDADKVSGDALQTASVVRGLLRSAARESPRAAPAVSAPRSTAARLTAPVTGGTLVNRCSNTYTYVRTRYGRLRRQ